MQVSLTVGAQRNWTALWKRTIDGLDALLGRTYPDRDWNPQDGRIVRLGLHVRRDQTFGHDVEATIWARPADLDWPELAGWPRWTKPSAPPTAPRTRRPLRRAAGTRTRLPPTTARSGGAQPRRRGRPPAPTARRNHRANDGHGVRRRGRSRPHDAQHGYGRAAEDPHTARTMPAASRRRTSEPR